MTNRTYKVVQWATGHVGKTAIRHFAGNPAFELVGTLVTNPAKVGRDAGEIAGIAPLGVIATDDPEAILALEADCVHFAPALPDLDMVSRLLRSGKNVVSPLGPFYRYGKYKDELDGLDAAAKAGGVSFHGSGIHPGFAGDLLPLTVLRIADRVDHIHLYEIIDHLANPSNYIEFMGFGRTPDDVLANPGRSPEAPQMFAQSMQLVLEALGLAVEDVTARLELATATQDIPYPNGVIRQGTVAGQHYEWTGWAGGKPCITYHCFWVMGQEHVSPHWDTGPSGYRIRIEGDPPMELSLTSMREVDGEKRYGGLPWTAMAGVNVIPAVCEAAPGVVTHREIGVPRMHGLIR
ncbi:NAD(P)H-dependent amine dehydrogenase family protein [Novosphingobium album (ex Liu et al. 2023)]|uniref:Dihydrodipicolinate reductase n=1 Tax=Novosphingobium album (ex Liu et al. 2023) TaxID=3031130 RepID=A0ABT5WND8_9SPHN|nr:hypothetical protein [Novosphingobium album (ex Liu et al. 2023)]MDE8651559.1 hypothetical protein [Novosphingobium album (ex Liu et al. 2023)]